MNKKTLEPGSVQPPVLPPILLVDDDEDFRAVLAKTIEDWGYTVSTAEDGQAALELIDSSDSQWLALITDFNMPRMTGGELVRAVNIRGVPFHAVVLFSSMNIRDTEVATLNSGMGGEVPFHFMNKPIQSSVLKGILVEAARQAHAAKDAAV